MSEGGGHARSPLDVLIEVELIHPSALHRHRTTARRNAAANTERTSLGASDADTCAVLIEEGTATLTKLLVRRILLPDLGEERERSLVGEEVEQANELRMQTARGGSDERQESRVQPLVIPPVVGDLALGSIDEHAIRVVRVPRLTMVARVVNGTVKVVHHSDINDCLTLIANLQVELQVPAGLTPLAAVHVTSLDSIARDAYDFLHRGEEMLMCRVPVATVNFASVQVVSINCVQATRTGLSQMRCEARRPKPSC